MLARVASRLTYANVIATIALFIALGGGAYATFALPNNSVGTRQLQNGAVTGKKLAANAVTGSKVAAGSLTGTQINEASLGTVPDAKHASTADYTTNAAHASTADAASDAALATDSEQLGGLPASSYVQGPVDPVHLLSTSDFAACDLASDDWQSRGSDFAVGYYRDPFGTVHLQGEVTCPGSPELGYAIFRLPSGYWPGQTAWEAAPETSTGFAGIEILSDGYVEFGSGARPSSGGAISLDGLNFRCAPSGSNGCP